MIYEDISWSTVEWHRWKGPIPLAMINDGPAKWKGSILSAVKIYDSAVRRSQLFASMEPTFAHQVKDLQSRQQPDEEDKDKDWYKYKHKYEQRQKQHKNSLSDPSLIIALCVKGGPWIKRCKKLAKVNLGFSSKKITNSYLLLFLSS